ncbi:MAG: OmpH family outer membrane protein [Elusimicrobia bacterium]|nr:OmpH family outer membrane protein [Elusimicrobiota bacterium]
MKWVKLFVLGLMCLVPFASRAVAQDLKIAYVDIARLFDEYEKTKDYEKVLEEENTKFQDERNQKIDKIRDLQSKLGVVKEADKAKTEEEIEAMKNEILEFDRVKRTDLTKARDEKVREILLEIEKTVSDHAKKEGLTFVLNDRTMIYGAENLNITEPILSTLNDSYKKQSKK